MRSALAKFVKEFFREPLGERDDNLMAVKE
jgi:hypothetical protein